jgi:hypothetical protein
MILIQMGIFFEFRGFLHLSTLNLELVCNQFKVF